MNKYTDDEIILSIGFECVFEMAWGGEFRSGIITSGDRGKIILLCDGGTGFIDKTCNHRIPMLDAIKGKKLWKLLYD
jgi:hypothetical protein